MDNRIDNKAFAKLARVPQILIALMLSFSVFIFATINIYQLNKMSFDFSISSFFVSLLIPFGLSMVCIWGMMMIARMLNRRLFMVIASTFFGLGIAFYVQGNFLCRNNTVLMGEEPEWIFLMGPAVVNLAVWFIIVLAMICFAMIKARLFLKVAVMASALLLVMEGGSIAVTGILSKQTTDMNPRAYPTIKDRYTVSEKGDILVFMLDAFDTRYMQTIIDEYPEWLEPLADFTYYPNTCSTYQRTDPSCVNFLSGERYYNQIPFYDWCDESLINAAFFKVLKENGYTLNFYGISDNLFPADMMDISDNLMQVEAKLVYPYSFVYSFMRMTMYKFGPMVLQPFMYAGDYSEVLLRNFDMTVMKATWSEREMVEGLTENGGFEVDRERKFFKFYHLQGAHSPENMDRFGNAIENDSGTIQERALGSLYMVGKILNALKESGTYESSMIVIMADHGYQADGNVANASNPIFLTKYPDQHGNGELMEINAEAQVSLEDFAPTCLDGAGIDYMSLGEPARNWVDRDRKRYFYAHRYMFPTLNGDFYLDALKEYRVPEDARNLEQYEETGNTY